MLAEKRFGRCPSCRAVAQWQIAHLVAICYMGVSFSEFICPYVSQPVTLAKFMSACKWSVSHGQTDFLFAQSTFEGYWDSFMPPGSFRNEICEEHDMFAFRVGPLTTNGGYSWNAVAASLVSSALPALRPWLFGVAAFVVGNTDDTGTLIGYPPIHQHHFHLYGSGDDSPWMNNHGDSQCLERDGGVTCLEHRLPPGCAYIIHSPVGFHTEFNDVRYANASTMSSWVVIAMQFLPFGSQARQVVDVGFGFGVTVGVPSNRNTFLLQTDLIHVVWTNCTYQKQVLNNLVEAYLHTHYVMVADLWLFRGTADSVFNDTRALASSWGRLNVGQAAKIDLTRSIQARQLQVDAATLIWSLRSAETAELVLGQTYYRKAFVPLQPGDENLVFVAFFENMNEERLGKYFPMHCFIHVYYARSMGKIIYRDALPTSVNKHLIQDRLLSHHSWPSVLAQYKSFKPLREHKLDYTH